ALITARKATRALRIGEFRRLDADRLLAFTRYTDRIEELAVVVVNPFPANAAVSVWVLHAARGGFYGPPQKRNTKATAADK
ncbi:MAG: hypothetical protein ACOVOX_01790, partial [Burkholderiaceae bacterium]